jgi:hypothetical protein
MVHLIVKVDVMLLKGMPAKGTLLRIIKPFKVF